MNEDFLFNIYAIVEEIPKGKVATYKQIAKLSNHPKNCRLVGKALRFSSLYGDFPCHRVLHSDGRLVDNWNEQRTLLQQEGITFLPNGKVDMKKHQWKAS